MPTLSYSLVLFVHLLTAITLFNGLVLSHAALARLRRAERVEQVRDWLRALASMAFVFPVSGVLLLLTGFYMARQAFRWNDGWVIVAIVGLVSVFVLGGTANRAGFARLGATLAGMPNGPVTPALHAAACMPSVWLSLYLMTGTVTGILLIMVTKPAAAVSAALVITGALIGGLVALPQARAARADAARPALASRE